MKDLYYYVMVSHDKTETRCVQVMYSHNITHLTEIQLTTSGQSTLATGPVKNFPVF